MNNLYVILNEDEAKQLISVLKKTDIDDNLRKKIFNQLSYSLLEYKKENNIKVNVTDLIPDHIYKIVTKPGICNISDKPTIWYVKYSHISEINNDYYIYDKNSISFDEKCTDIMDFFFVESGEFSNLDDIESIEEITDPIMIGTYDQIINKFINDNSDLSNNWNDEVMKYILKNNKKVC